MATQVCTEAAAEFDKAATRIEKQMGHVYHAGRWIADGHEYATDARILISRTTTAPDKMPEDKRAINQCSIDIIFQETDTPWKPWPTRERVHGEGICPQCYGHEQKSHIIACKNCSGTGRAKCPECEQNCDCWGCLGSGKDTVSCGNCMATGKITGDVTQPIEGDEMIDGFYDDMIRSLQVSEYQCHRDGRVLFRFPGGFGCVMQIVDDGA